MHKHLIVFTVAALMGSAACAESQAEQVKDARMEQAAAQADAKESNIENSADARHKALDREYDARKENIAAANRPDESASKDLNNISKDRALYQSEALTRVDKLGVRIDEAAKKINVLGARAPSTLATELKTAATEHNLLKQDIDKLNNTRTTDWESVKSQLDNRLSALDSRVKDLNSSIDDVHT